MRHLLPASFALLLGLSGLSGCAQSVVAGTGGSGGSPSTGGSVTGGSGTGGGTGGSDCTDEVCDGKDNNCDGEVDEGCECLEGDTEPCYSGDPITQAIGACKDGVRTCDPATNKFGACEGEILPSAEACDGVDNDCNNLVDDGLPDLVCGVGTCMATAPACVNGAPGTCVPGAPSQELCDGLDNDCDQLVDDAFPESGMSCDSGLLGACKAGKFQCNAGSLECVANQMAGSELCDGLDNDCNGTVDDNVPGTGGDCSTGQLGVCDAGKISCQNNVVDCFSVVPSSPEVCDGLDNNCNGTVDENDPEGGGACATGQLGACATGTFHCVQGAVLCQPDALAQPEVCDGVDNNCDGQADEGSPGAGTPCSCGGNSVCQNGALFCQGCTKEVDCNNGIDDDADGAVDCADSQCAAGCSAAVPPCPAGQKLLVLSSSDVPKTIPDNTTVNSVIAFSENNVVKRVTLLFSITHSFDADLDITLKSPMNTSVDVSSDNGSLGDNYTQTLVSDTCGTPIASGTAPFTGCFSPEAPLGALVDQPVNGTWTLAVADDASIDTGTLTAWSLAICVQ